MTGLVWLAVNVASHFPCHELVCVSVTLLCMCKNAIDTVYVESRSSVSNRGGRGVVSRPRLLAATESLGNWHIYEFIAQKCITCITAILSCDPDMQYTMVLILQSDWTRLYAGALHKLVYATFQYSPQCAKSLGMRPGGGGGGRKRLCALQLIQ